MSSSRITPASSSRNLVEHTGESDRTRNRLSPISISDHTDRSSGRATSSNAAVTQEDDDEDDDCMDARLIQSIAEQIQHAPVEFVDGVAMSRPKIIIPKRGEKDFEPLQETVKLQEMMLQSSRQSLFDALQGVRGVASKALSHAIITPASPFPQLLISRGHVLDSMGITVRRQRHLGGGKTHSRVELLPEEALYLLERGTLQIWNGTDPQSSEEIEDGIGEWCEEYFGVKGAIEISVMEAFGLLMGKDGLTWERYQAYSSLKRLGYTVQRSRQFIPKHFLIETADGNTQQLSIWDWPSGILSWLHLLGTSIVVTGEKTFAQIGLWSQRLWFDPFRMTALRGWRGATYSSMLEYLRFIQAGHCKPVPPQNTRLPSTSSIYGPLVLNPYLPFFHVWKPVTPWSKARWDRGSSFGLSVQKPDYYVAVVEARSTAMPTLTQLNKVFENLPDEPKGPPLRVGPQYERQKKHPSKESHSASSEGSEGWLGFFYSRMFSSSYSSPPPFVGNALGALRNGDRALVVAVNDSGNTGWVRFGRTDFGSVTMI